MTRYFILIASLIFSNYLFAQSEEAQIRATLNNYMDGTAYSKTELIDKAFYPEAELFLDGRDKQLSVVPIAQYASWFKDREPGKFTGRIGRILSVDHFGNIAMAKVEILILGSSANRRFIDMFILKKIKEEWKIISKTANSETTNRAGNRILFVVSNASYYGDSKLTTGNSFKEIVDVFDTYDQAGYTVDFVSPKGGAVPLAYINTADELQKKYVYNPDFMYALKNTQSPEQVNAENYEAIYFVGGGGAMFGVPENAAIQKIAMEIYEEHQGIISSICHGTAGIVNLKTKDGQYLVKGKTVSGYPEAYERKDADYFKEFPFLIQKTIEERGGTFKVAPRNKPHMEAYGNLITGQNHLSCKLVAQKVIETLKNKRSE